MVVCAGPQKCGWLTIGRVDKGGKLCHKASYSIQHLVPPDGVESILKVQFEDNLTKVVQ